MEKTTWKIIAIVFMTLFIVETAFIGWSVSIYYDELEMTNECYYEFCKDYPTADLIDGICTCYDYDLLGDFEAVDYKIMG